MTKQQISRAKPADLRARRDHLVCNGETPTFTGEEDAIGFELSQRSIDDDRVKEMTGNANY